MIIQQSDARAFINMLWSKYLEACREMDVVHDYNGAASRFAGFAGDYLAHRTSPEQELVFAGLNQKLRNKKPRKPRKT